MGEDGSSTAWSAPTLGATDSEVGDTLTWSVKTAASNGTATVSGSSASPSVPTTFTYVPDGNFSGSDFFVVQVSDGGSLPATITVNVTVDPVADAPVITTTASKSIVENQTAVVTVVACRW